jgi:energy-coupling factor transporter ATP-binding protein EcfA2
MSTMASFRLRWIEVTRYRNVSSGTELSFGGGLNVVLGRNGAGKSALLRLLAALSTGKLEPIKDEPFHVSCGLTAGELALSVTIENDPGGDASWSVELGHGDASGDICSVAGVDGEATLHVDGYDDDDGHDLSITSPFDGGSLYAVLDEIANAYEFDEVAGEGDTVDWTVERIRGAWEALEAVADNLGCFGEGLEVFGSITGDDLGERLGDTDRAYVSVDLKDRKAEVSYATFIPAEIRDALARKELEAFAADALHVSSGEAPFLRRAAEALGAEEVTLVLPVRERKEAKDGKEVTMNDLELRVVKGGGEAIPHDQLSHGEKRLLSFFYYAAANPHVVITDDLVSGMAYDGAEAAVAALAGRQAFVSTRDPWLFAFLQRPAEGEDDMTLITCAAQSGKEGTVIAWDTLDEPTTEALLAAREAGLDRVATILRAEDLC